MDKLLTQYKGNGLKAQLLRGASGTVALKIVNIFLTLATGVLLARTLGPENYGIYAFVLSITALLGMPTKAGLPTLLLREIARNQLNERWGMIRGLLKLANSFVVSYSIIVAIVSGLFVWLQWGGSDIIKVDTFLWALWLLPIIAFEGLRTGALRGLRWVVSSQLPEQMIRPLVMILLLGAALLLNKELTSTIAVQLNVIAALAAFMVGTLFLFMALPQEVKQAKPEYTIRPWVGSMLPLSLFAGLKMLDAQVSIIFLGMLSTTNEVGLFKVAATGAGLVALGLTAVNMALAPQVARLYKAGEIEKLQRIITSSTRAAMAIALPVAGMFFVWGEELISLVFGSEYVKAAMALGILCIGQLVNTSTGSVAVILNMTGHEKETIKGAVAAILLNLIFSILLIPVYGISGAAVAYVASLLSWNVMLMVMVHKKTGLKTFVV